jgi:DNA-binding NarL/FixJ family response regulator
MNTIKTAIVEDDPRYQQLLWAILLASEKITPVFTADNCLNIISEVRKHQPDVVIMDINLPGKSGIDGVLELKHAFPQTRVIMLTVFEDEEKIFAAIKAGAEGYLLKKDSPQKILDSIQDVYEGKSSMNGIIARKVMEYFHKKPAVKNPDEYSLTKRELEILELLIEGLSYKDIAEKCFISVQTLNSHIKNIYTKLGVHSRAEAAAKFRE